MKKLLLSLSLILTILPASILSQPFVFTRITPETVIGDSSDVEIVGYAFLNPNSTTLQITLKRTINELSQSWDSIGCSICNHNGCYPPNVDSITSTYAPGLGDDTISIHFYCKSAYPFPQGTFLEGWGHARLRAYVTSNPTQYIELDFRAATHLTIGIKQISSIVKDFSLGQNYPNPFNPSTKIDFAVPKSGHISLRVFDMLGREVKVLVNDVLSAGEYEVNFDSEGLSSGMYYYTLTSGNSSAVKKMVLVK